MILFNLWWDQTVLALSGMLGSCMCDPEHVITIVTIASCGGLSVCERQHIRLCEGCECSFDSLFGVGGLMKEVCGIHCAATPAVG